MSTLSTVYDLVMQGSSAEVEEVTGSAVHRPTQCGPLGGVETLLEGLDAVTAVYEPAGR